LEGEETDKADKAYPPQASETEGKINGEMIPRETLPPMLSLPRRINSLRKPHLLISDRRLTMRIYGLS
jgi:hypothetical protein